MSTSRPSPNEHFGAWLEEPGPHNSVEESSDAESEIASGSKGQQKPSEITTRQRGASKKTLGGQEDNVQGVSTMKKDFPML